MRPRSRDSRPPALLNNITANPDNAACFTYQERTVNNVPYVVDVAITLTVKTADKEPADRARSEGDEGAAERLAAQRLQRLAVAGLGISGRVQPLPASVQTLIGLP